jgi:hypothetical protein
MNKEYSMAIDGQQVSFEFKDGLVHAEGDHAGNIDAIITTTPPLPQNLLLDELHIKVPDTNEYLYIYGYGVVENSLKATFNAAKVINKQNLPEKVDIYWGPNGEKYIGEMNCMPYSEKVEHDLDDEVTESVEPVDSEKTTELAEDFKEEIKVEKSANEKVSTENETPKNKNLIIITAVVIAVIIALALIFL